MVSHKLGATSCWLMVCLLAAAAAAGAAAAKPLATTGGVKVVPQAVPEAVSSIFKSITVFPPMVGTGSTVEVTVKLNTAASAAVTYNVNASTPFITCEPVTFAAGNNTATTKCEIDQGCELGAYRVNVTAPGTLVDSKTSTEYHVACKNDFDRKYGPFKFSEPGCQECFQDCVTKLFTCKTCKCKCPNVTRTPDEPRFPNKTACEAAEVCDCDHPTGVIVNGHQCHEVKYDVCEDKFICKLNKYYYDSHEHKKHRDYVPTEDWEEDNYEAPQYEEEDRGYDGYFGDGGEHRAEHHDEYYSGGEGHGEYKSRGEGHGEYKSGGEGHGEHYGKGEGHGEYHSKGEGHGEYHSKGEGHGEYHSGGEGHGEYSRGPHYDHDSHGDHGSDHGEYSSGPRY